MGSTRWPRRRRASAARRSSAVSSGRLDQVAKASRRSPDRAEEGTPQLYVGGGCSGNGIGTISSMQSANVSSRGDRAVLGLPHLKLVRAIVREGGITKAAARLHLTQPALSHQLKDAEERLGTRLFLRQGRRLVPTAAGERLVRAAEAVLSELGAAE